MRYVAIRAHTGNTGSFTGGSSAAMGWMPRSTTFRCVGREWTKGTNPTTVLLLGSFLKQRYFSRAPGLPAAIRILALVHLVFIWGRI